MSHITIIISRAATPPPPPQSGEAAESVDLATQVTFVVPHDMDHNEAGRKVAQLIKGIEKLGS